MKSSSSRGILFRIVPLLWVASLSLITGCATTPPPATWSQQQSATLQEALTYLGNQVDADEAARIAETAVQQPILLADQYRAVRPPWLHNYFVNLGWRQRGLCYHWANDLFARLHEKPVHSLQLHLAVAYMDTRREHNAVIVTARGQGLSQGVVLDAWRHSGRVWWGRVETDKYPWQPLPDDRVNPDLHEFVAR